MQVGIIVTATRTQADEVLQRLNAGMDFAVLAKERSIDPTSSDGGYLGSVTPDQLPTDYRAALADHTPGQLSSIFAVKSGFAILKILTAAPVTKDLTGDRLNALISNGAIHYGAFLDGSVEADRSLLRYPKPQDWNRNMQQVCEFQKESYARSIERLTTALAILKPGGAYSASDILQGHMDLAQLLSYQGRMAESIKELETAYRIAQTIAPGKVPNLEETIGVAYLHLSEMENGVYLHPSDLDIFPPLNPKASYKKTYNSKLAIEYFTKYLAHIPDDVEVKWLLNLAYMTLGQYPAGVPANYLIPESDFKSKENIGRFIDVAPAAGLDVFRGAGGVAVDDFENNGLLDIVVSSMDVCDPIRYFHNNGDGTFTDRTAAAGLSDQLGGLNIVQADYNNDGCMDLLILRGGWQYPQKKSLMRNNCNGTFTDVTDAAGLGGTLTSTNSAAWADIDNDGYLDLFIANENSPSQLFRNKGDGTFEDISHAAGIDKTTFAKGVTAADYDNDGYVDFYVSNYGGPNFLYHNNGNGTFTEIGRQAGVQAPWFSFSTWFFDYDNDGWPDLFVNTFLHPLSESLDSYLGLPHNAETLRLYRNKHDGTFEDVTEKVGLDKVFMTMGANFGDIDNDGFLDVYLGNGNPSYSALIPHVLLRNDEGKSFTDITASSGTGELHKGHGTAFADLDRSGNEAIITNVGGMVPGDRHAMRVFENPGNNNDWINVHLVGVKSNRSGVGAQIKVTVSDDGHAPRTIFRVVGETSSFGANPMEQHIGLGHDAGPVTLDVWWPTSGTRQHFTGVEKNEYIEIKEFSNAVSKLVRPRFRLGAPNATAAPSAANSASVDKQ
ncbi:MAG TPA: FG-GAP-like repeat-containing protein [Terracidiphilus sp.]|nr:FG-GAP-like repeat-containing protein [Terracidiphilus sp.]